MPRSSGSTLASGIGARKTAPCRIGTKIAGQRCSRCLRRSRESAAAVGKGYVAMIRELSRTRAGRQGDSENTPSTPVTTVAMTNTVEKSSAIVKLVADPNTRGLLLVFIVRSRHSIFRGAGVHCRSRVFAAGLADHAAFRGNK